MTRPMSAGVMSSSASAPATDRLTTRQSLSTSSGPPTPVSTSTAPPGWVTTKPCTGHSRPSTPRRLARCSRLISSDIGGLLRDRVVARLYVRANPREIDLRVLRHRPPSHCVRRLPVRPLPMIFAVTEIVVVHYPGERAENWALLRKAARARGVRLVSWAPHLLGFWCADGQQYVSYAGKTARPEVVIHRTVAPFRGIVVPALTRLAAEGSRVLNDPEAAFRSRDKLLTTMDLVRAGVPVVPTVAFDEPDGVNLAVLGPAELILKPARGVRGEGVVAFRSAAAVSAASQRRGPRPAVAGYYA